MKKYDLKVNREKIERIDLIYPPKRCSFLQHHFGSLLCSIIFILTLNFLSVFPLYVYL